MSDRRSSRKDDSGPRPSSRATSTHEDQAPSDTADTSRSESAQWATAPSTKNATSRDRSVSRNDPEATPAMEEMTEQSSDDSDDESDELQDPADDDGARNRELSVGSITSDTPIVPSKDLVYVLEVIQQPQRARACGFGDKDRRPLSPPPIVQLRVFDSLGKAIAPHVIDFHRFVLMVDLWKGDQSQQRSIVMHPGARQDQYALFTHTASRPPTSSAPYPYESPQPGFNRGLRPGSGHATVPPPFGWQGSGAEWSPYAGRSGQIAPPGHPSHSGPAPVSGWPPPESASPAQRPYGLPHEDWYDERAPPPSSSSRGVHEPPHPGMRSSSGRGSRGWTPESTQLLTDYDFERPHTSYSNAFRPATSAADSAWHKDPYAGSRDDRPHTAGYGDWERRFTPSARPWSSSGDSQRARSLHGPLFTHAPATSPMNTPVPLPLTSSPSAVPASLYTESYAERLSTTSHYSRVLVGSMGAVCQRLKGLNGEPGLFFFAHDLGIRTEGTFSLRFTLADLTNLTVPDVTKDQSAPILARIFSKSFTVYSAKRFPGVLPTTALTQCFADQSVRLPTRQKRAHHESTSAPKRKK